MGYERLETAEAGERAARGSGGATSGAATSGPPVTDAVSSGPRSNGATAMPARGALEVVDPEDPRGGETPWSRRRRLFPSTMYSLLWVSVAVAAAVVINTFIYFAADVDKNEDRLCDRQRCYVIGNRSKRVTRVAFGSCTRYNLGPQPMWQAIAGTDPDAFLWDGDFAYLDDPIVNCADPAYSNSTSCSCPTTWLSRPGDGSSCTVANVANAAARWEEQLQNSDYRAFLEFMCPGHTATGDFPPPGRNQRVCPRVLSGTWDDHDYGWNNGDRRLPHRDVFQKMYLDALGEDPGSRRRNVDRGIYDDFELWTPRGSVHVVMLDERSWRSTMPCYIRREWCRKVMEANTSGWAATCRDWYVDGGVSGQGSCCQQDDAVFMAYCGSADAASDPLYPIACDPTHPDYASRPLHLEGGRLAEGLLWDPDLSGQLGMCDVLGLQQRRWLQSIMRTSQADVMLVLSGSVLLSNPAVVNSPANNFAGQCGGGDDFDCYRPAGINLLHTLATPEYRGCVAVVAGDWHFADLKMVGDASVGPGDRPYAAPLRADSLSKPIYQIMASAMTAGDGGTAHKRLVCDPSDPDGWAVDHSGLRVKSTANGTGVAVDACHWLNGPNFGTAEVDWDDNRACLQVHQQDGSIWDQICFSLSDCKPRPPPQPRST